MVLISNILDIRSLEQIHYQFLKDQCHIDILYGPFAININQVLWIFNTVLNQFPPSLLSHYTFTFNIFYQLSIAKNQTICKIFFKYDEV